MTARVKGRPTTRAFYEIELRPNTGAAEVAEEVARGLGDPVGRMRVLAIWSVLRGARGILGATIVYQAIGANRNDVWRRVCSISPLVRSQVTVMEIATFNVDSDPATRPGVPWLDEEAS